MRDSARREAEMKNTGARFNRAGEIHFIVTAGTVIIILFAIMYYFAAQ